MESLHSHAGSWRHLVVDTAGPAGKFGVPDRKGGMGGISWRRTEVAYPLTASGKRNFRAGVVYRDKGCGVPLLMVEADRYTETGTVLADKDYYRRLVYDRSMPAMEVSGRELLILTSVLISPLLAVCQSQGPDVPVSRAERDPRGTADEKPA
ncbi:hypothetical protein ACFO3J_25195 [Streptomyces polygonati]|uniref:Transposase IS701-like DDE domain-containing protein n=1 Tax=Streptomyces polygonati TaxID=1617087 RepID=A0ABV8HWZ8_9ACTN